MSTSHPRRGILFLLSAPSGAGKSTLRTGLQRNQDFSYSVSCTTRAPRPGERDGEDYHFLTREAFEEQIAAGAFLEHAQVHGNYYGTLKSAVLGVLRAGGDVLLDIDTQGAARIRANAGPEIQAALVDIFLMPESLDVLRRRLAKRGTETPEQIALRLRNAETELREWRAYRYALVTSTPEEDLAGFRAIMQAERSRSERLLFDPILS
ncbi:MAG: guanylate kinase [Chthoniobacteraceae bacterium]|nr:guanylate kinase [Chthoniobacteraceae bacterium]